MGILKLKIVEDSFQHRGMRQLLVQEIKRKGITDLNVLEAINCVPRHLFMDSSFVQFAYRDKAFPIAEGQTISQPFTVAYQTQCLAIQRGDKLLEIGTGSGYQAAVLCEMGATVYTVERQRKLYESARSLLPKLGYYPQFFYGDGYNGLPSYGPFDKIIVTAAAPSVPKALIDQLKVGGKMVIPIGESQIQTMKLITKESDATIREEEHGNFVFVPLLGGLSG